MYAQHLRELGSVSGHLYQVVEDFALAEGGQGVLLVAIL